MKVYYIFPSILVCLILEVLSVSCVAIKPQCPNCTLQLVKTINATTGKCVDCWPCPECHEGSGSTVQCGSTVTVGTQIRCVPCIPGANFSDSFGTGQCQPCGECLGKHEEALSECTRHSDIKCECKVGFYRNRTTQECLPCASCCSGDGDVLEKCQIDGGTVKKKCKFEDSGPSTCLSSVKAVATSSSLMTFSYKHSTATPMLSSITKIAPAPSETVNIKITASFSRHGSRPSKVLGTSTVNNGNDMGEKPNNNIVIHFSKTAIILISLFVCALVFAACSVCIYVKFRSWRSRNNPPALNMTYNELEAREDERRKSSECSGVSEPLLQLTEHPPGGTTLLSLETGGGICLLPENSREDTVPKGIPSSLDDEPQNLAHRTRKRLASEGDDKSASDLEGHQSQCHIEEEQDGLITVHASVHPALPSAPPNVACPSSSTNSVAVPSALTLNNSSNAEQTSGLPSLIETDMEIDVANQGAVCGLSIEPPIQSTEDNRGYNTHIKDVPESVILDMCMLLDEERDIDGKNYKLLASELELKPAKIRYLKELKQMGKSPSCVLLMQIFSARENSGTLHHLSSILKKMERFDVIKVLDDWVLNNP